MLQKTFNRYEQIFSQLVGEYFIFLYRERFQEQKAPKLFNFYTKMFCDARKVWINYDLPTQNIHLKEWNLKWKDKAYSTYLLKTQQVIKKKEKEHITEKKKMPAGSLSFYAEIFPVFFFYKLLHWFEWAWAQMKA